MHGVKRTAKRDDAKEKAKVEKIKKVRDDFLEARKPGLSDDHAFNSTTALLTLVPEYYTAWNVRRLILQKRFSNCNVEDLANLLRNEFDFLSVLMKTQPKIYWLWNHRKWCVETARAECQSDIALQSCNAEMALVTRMLEYDSRNFHGWNYRRYITSILIALEPQKTRQILESELAYTLQKIESNFSNFSAWYQRSELFPRVAREQGWVWGDESNATYVQTREKELDLIQQAMYTDPNDQSIWYYHQLLMLNASRELIEKQTQSIQELIDIEPDAKWCILALLRCKEQLEPLLTEERLTSSRDERKALLVQLRSLDSLRKTRYQDLIDRLG